MPIIKGYISENDYNTLITFINKKYYVDVVSLIKELMERGDIKIE